MRRLLTVAIVCGGLAIAGSAGAQEGGEVTSADRGGDFGVGPQATLAGLAGIGGQYYLSDSLSVHGVFLLDIFAPDMGDTTTTFGLGVGVTYYLAKGSRTRLGIGGGIVYGMEKGMDTANALAIEAPLRAEIFPTDNLMVYLALGPTFIINMDPDNTVFDGAGFFRGFGLEGFSFNITPALTGSSGILFIF